MYTKWMCPAQKTKAEIRDAIILEQFLRMLNPELRILVKERNLVTSNNAADLAEAFITARQIQYGGQLCHTAVLESKYLLRDHYRSGNHLQLPFHETGLLPIGQ